MQPPIQAGNASGGLRVLRQGLPPQLRQQVGLHSIREAVFLIHIVLMRIQAKIVMRM